MALLTNHLKICSLLNLNCPASLPYKPEPFQKCQKLYLFGSLWHCLLSVTLHVVNRSRPQPQFCCYAGIKNANKQLTAERSKCSAPMTFVYFRAQQGHLVAVGRSSTDVGSGVLCPLHVLNECCLRLVVANKKSQMNWSETNALLPGLILESLSMLCRCGIR